MNKHLHEGITLVMYGRFKSDHMIVIIDDTVIDTVITLLKPDTVWFHNIYFLNMFI